MLVAFGLWPAWSNRYEQKAIRRRRREMRIETCRKSVLFPTGLYIRCSLAAVLFMGGVVLADWNIGDPALYYQTPDFNGWSVYSEWGTGPAGVADNWTAAVTAPITDIHFWGGWENDIIGQTGNILIQIFNNNSANPDFPQPDERVWWQVIPQGQYTTQFWASNPTDNQGWYDPVNDQWQANNHADMFQYSIPIITDEFTPEAGQTYWLMISMDFWGGWLGWNTAQNVNGGSAVFWDWNTSEWVRLETPDSHVPLDLAFVLVPEPAMILLFGLGAAFVRRRRDR
jgi:hypothetical protein